MKRLVVILAILLLIPLVSADTLFIQTTNSAVGGDADSPYYYTGSLGDYSALRSANGNYVTGEPMSVALYAGGSSGKYMVLSVNVLGFNTSGLNSSMTISSAKVGIKGSSGKAQSFSTKADYVLTNATPGTWSAIAAGDYQQRKYNQMAANISYDDISDSTWNNWTLNAAGLAYLRSRLNPTANSNTSFAVVDSWDFNGVPPTWGDGATQEVYFLGAATGTASNRPFLEVVWTMGGGSAPVAAFTKNQTAGTAPLPVGFTDTSTNTPTAWNWSFNNVTGNNTVVYFDSINQNPSITLGTGNWTFALNASNAYGFNITPSLAWVNVSAAPEGCGLLCKMLHYFWQFRLPYQVMA